MMAQQPNPFDPNQLTPNGPGSADPYAPGYGITPGSGSLPPDPTRPGQGLFRPGYAVNGQGWGGPTGAPTTQDFRSLGGGPSSTLEQMSPAEREAYLRAQQQNPNNVGKGWADNGAYNTYAAPLMAKYAGDPNMTQRVTGGIQQAQQIATNGWNPAADVNAYQLGGDPAYATGEAQRFKDLAAGAATRTGPTVDTSTVTPWQGGAYTAGMAQMGAAGKQAGQGDFLGGLAASGGAGTGPQGQAGNALMALGQMPAGPSAAELAMERTADQANAAQASLAAGARGGNSALALTNAAANQGNIGTNLAGQIGVQRASEDLANRNFAANALTGASNVYGQQSQQQTVNAAQAGGAYGGAGSTAGGAGQTFGTEAGINAGIATADANNEGQQRNLNDTTAYHYNTGANDVLGTQLTANQNYDTHRTGDYFGEQGVHNQKTITDFNTDSITGSPSLDKLGAAGISGGATAMGGYKSDVRSKKDIQPADAKIADAFRAADQDAAKIRDTDIPYPVAGYQPPPNAWQRFATGFSQGMASDVRSKSNIRDAAPAISGAFRQADRNAADIRNEYIDSYPEEMTGYNPPATPDQLRQFAAIDRQAEIRRRARIEQPVIYDERADVMRSPLEQIRYSRGALADARGPLRTPGYEYEYKDPSSPGARPGPQYGIMAQDLEKTPAGASVVGEKNGRKFVDPGRLSLLTAAEVAKQRQELDQLQGMASQISAPKVPYPAAAGGYGY